jgi:hypothetical protein
MRTGFPFSTDVSIVLGILGLESLVTFRSFDSQVFLSQTMPYSYGSIIREYRSEFVRIAPFSVDT